MFCGLRPNGDVTCWCVPAFWCAISGYCRSGIVRSLAGPFIAISTAWDTNLAIRADGTLAVWDPLMFPFGLGSDPRMPTEDGFVQIVRTQEAIQSVPTLRVFRTVVSHRVGGGV